VQVDQQVGPGDERLEDVLGESVRERPVRAVRERPGVERSRRSTMTESSQPRDQLVGRHDRNIV
jgi:hypothetical protein